MKSETQVLALCRDVKMFAKQFKKFNDYYEVVNKQFNYGYPIMNRQTFNRLVQVAAMEAELQ